MTFLRARGLVKSYGHTPALRGVTLDVAEGEIVAVTGPSGCGKSTLLHCLAGILRPDAGEVLYREHRLDTCRSGCAPGCAVRSSACCSSSGSSSPS